MMNAVEFDVPDSTLRYILFQRTGYVWYLNTWIDRLLRKLNLKPSFKTIVLVESVLRKKKIKRQFLKGMAAEYQTIADVLPSSAAHILDIGCGMAGIDLFIDRHYHFDKPIFHLLDKSGMEEKVYYGFKENASFYNSLPIAKEFLSRNGISANRVRTYEVIEGKNEIKLTTQCDLVISLLSWGFHYPVHLYIDQVFDLLRQGGRVILDIRNGSDGEDELQRYFFTTKEIYHGEKHRRFLAIK